MTPPDDAPAFTSPLIGDRELAAVLKLAREHVALASECVMAVSDHLERRELRALPFADTVLALTYLDQARAKVNTAREGLLRGSED